MNGSKNSQNSKSIIYMCENFKEPMKEYNNGHSGAHTSNPSRREMKRKWVKNSRTSLAIWDLRKIWTTQDHLKKWEKEKRERDTLVNSCSIIGNEPKYKLQNHIVVEQTVILMSWVKHSITVTVELTITEKSPKYLHYITRSFKSELCLSKHFRDFWTRV